MAELAFALPSGKQRRGWEGNWEMLLVSKRVAFID
jgi:hypothetical protein